MYNQKQKDNFFNAIESLKKYRRADLVDEKGRNLLEKLYTDLLPSEHILKKSIKDNTTFLIGRKGTGKSTIFLRIEQELRKKDAYLPCYIDVKTIYESAQTDYLNLDYLSEYIPPKTLKKYLIERSFIQSTLKSIAKEIHIKYDNWFDKIKNSIFDKTASKQVKTRIEELIRKIEDNEILKEIEIPVVKNIVQKEKGFKENNVSTSNECSNNLQFGLHETISASLFMGDKDAKNKGETTSIEVEDSFSSVFLQIFQIKSYIENLKDILKYIQVKHIVILLDDFSEIDDYAIKTFVDVILAPLNNWSDEFIKFKIAAYPNRIYYGKIDLGKVDIINLDFYNLYSEFDRNKMEEGAIDFTKRLIEKRIEHFTKEEPSLFFDLTRSTLNEYYELIFQASMNVPRVIGYLLSYCYQSRIIYNKPISKSDIEAASQRYYEEKIEPFFLKITYSLLSMDEKIDQLQLKDLLEKFIDKLIDNKRKITTGIYTGETYIQSSPYASHFHIATAFESFLSTLELNFFISKYIEMSDKDGQSSSVFCLNYGLAKKYNLLWGKPKGTKYRKYFIERPFSFNNILRDFLSSSQSIHCTNEECRQMFTQDQLPHLEFANFKCNKCQSSVVIESIADKIKDDLKKISSDILLMPAEVEIIMELSKREDAVIAKDIAEELDMSSQSVANRCRMLDLKKGLINRDKSTNPYAYSLSINAKKLYS